MDESLEQQIAEMEEGLAPLRIEYENLKRKFEAKQTAMARYEALYMEKVQLDREIAAMKRGDPPGGPPHKDGEEESDL